MTNDRDRKHLAPEFLYSPEFLYGVASSLVGTFLATAAPAIFTDSVVRFFSLIGMSEPSEELIWLACFVISVLFVGVPVYVIFKTWKNIKRTQQENGSLRRKEEQLQGEVQKFQDENQQLEEEKQQLQGEIQKFQDAIQKLQKESFSSLPHRLGLIHVWENMKASQEEMMKCCLATGVKEIKILLHCETGLLGSDNILGEILDRMISKYQEGNYRLPDSIKILAPALDNPYYNDPGYNLKLRATRKKTNQDSEVLDEEYIRTRKQTFKTKIERLHAKIESLKVDGFKSKIEAQGHDQPYLWNLIVVDGKVFVQGDVDYRSIENAPIMLFQKNDEGNFLNQTYYFTFVKYFNDLWDYRSKPIACKIEGGQN